MVVQKGIRFGILNCIIVESSLSNKEVAENDRSEVPVRTSKAHTVFEILKEEILKGEIGPNERLIQQDLVNRFGVSKTPVREALSMLRNEGLVRGQYYRGMSVIPISRTTLRDLYELREALEGLAARTAAVRRDGVLAEALTENITAQSVAIGKDEFYQLNASFHELIVAKCGNHELRRVASVLYHQNRVLTSSSVNPLLNIPKPRSTWVLTEHRDIAYAIFCVDADLSDRTARKHVRNSFIRLSTGYVDEGDDDANSDFSALALGRDSLDQSGVSRMQRGGAAME